MNKGPIIKMLILLTAIVIIFSSLSRLLGNHSKTLEDYAKENPEIAYKQSETAATETTEDSENQTSETTQQNPGDSTASGQTTQIPDSGTVSESPENTLTDSALVGPSLNGDAMAEERILYQDGFYYEPLSDRLRRYITGVTYPDEEENLEISYDNLRYVHIVHIDFDGNATEGELICNEKIAQDLVEIFYQLYQNEYQLEKVRLIDEYDGDDISSMEDNNTSCFNYRVVEGSTSLSKHALGLAIDINPLYNPYITYHNGTQEISPAAAEPYADRSSAFPYKIDETDLCYKLFREHGFTWGGNWNSSKDYQHFQKTDF